MSWWKEKKKPRLRRCHINISPKCKAIFKTKFKRVGKRTACDKCHEHLHKIGINVEEYLKMSETEESFEKINENEIRATLKNIIEIKNEKNETIGTKKEEYVQMTTIKEMKEGIENIKERISQNKKQVKIFEKQKENIGKIPMKGGEMVRLEANITKIAKINKAEELNNKIEPLEKQIEEDMEVVKKRLEFLNG